MFPFWIDFSFVSVMQVATLFVALVSWLTAFVSGRSAGI